MKWSNRWAKIESVNPGARLGEMIVKVRYNLKHPSFWPVLWGMFEMRPAIFKPFVFLWALWTLNRKCGA